MKPVVISFFHDETCTFTYVVFDAEQRSGVVIDPVLDFDQASGKVSYESANKVLDYVNEHQLTIEWILETHAHADHLTAAQYLKDNTNAQVAIGKGIAVVQKTFKKIYNLSEKFPVEGEQFDRCFSDGDSFSVGSLTVDVIATPGHTNDSVTYLIGDAAFIGDTLFHPSLGTARCDFPGGDAAMLFNSIQRLFALPQNTRIFLCHDYPEGDRSPICQVTLAEQKIANIHVKEGNSKQDFIAFRTARDHSLAVPRLLLPAIQVNIAAGHFPTPESDQQVYLKSPVTFPQIGD
ncbi:MBL fold metallo-hydrolase [Thalassotalea sp. 1_MG-2023]|uniref:MBL fold metallo-hydrolase n=1 Tax=Thalassotalea sp. 1_MG-2023 TaxID=3062680 RepID=UPI0026E13E7D|nr:MBL fold metallo-hydrolase [Thalassotalea sp. 1_MG-2023]MDO6428175.1 MBL fold metallo-hydrolase [Thalassotalea sp. 1_MG-2023]